MKFYVSIWCRSLFTLCPGFCPSPAPEVEAIAAQRSEILSELESTGAIWFRGYDLMKSKEGFQRFYEALSLEPCRFAALMSK